MPTSAYPGHYAAYAYRLLLLGQSLPLGLAAGCLLSVSTATESQQWVTLFRVSILRDRRTVLYAGSHEWTPYKNVVVRPETVPVWASLLTDVGWVSMTTPQHTFTRVVHSHLLNGVVPVGLALTAFPSRF